MANCINSIIQSSEYPYIDLDEEISDLILNMPFDVMKSPRQRIQSLHKSLIELQKKVDEAAKNEFS